MRSRSIYNISSSSRVCVAAKFGIRQAYGCGKYEGVCVYIYIYMNIAVQISPQENPWKDRFNRKFFYQEA